MRLVPGPLGVELGGHSNCCDFGKPLSKLFSAFSPSFYSWKLSKKLHWGNVSLSEFLPEDDSPIKGSEKAMNLHGKEQDQQGSGVVECCSYYIRLYQLVRR